jgi:hypothetical protein
MRREQTGSGVSGRRRANANGRGRHQVDILLVALGTTRGGRRTETELMRALQYLGVTVAAATSDFGLVGRLRHRTPPLTDIVEAASMRRALARALERYEPRAIVYSKTGSAFLQPRRRLKGRTAVFFDTPSVLHRPGRRNSLQHWLERRSLRHVRMLMPRGLEPDSAVVAAVPRGPEIVALPLPIRQSASRLAKREPFALSYAGKPHKKGLDILIESWALAKPHGITLMVAGIDADFGRRFLAERHIEEPPGVQWLGSVPPARFRELGGRARFYVACSRYENYGLAQLEALADGAVLVTVPSRGPYEALRLARELDDRVVAKALSAEALAEALRHAVALTQAERRAYAERSGAMVRPYSHDVLVDRLRERVLPRLLDHAA